MPEVRHAVLIGNTTYPEEPRLASLRCPAEDVKGIRAQLTSERNGLFDPANIVCKVDAPHYEILQAVESLARKASKSDLLLIYYSGHGQCDEAGRLHLAALNTKLDMLGSTSVPMEQIKSYIDLAKTKRIILILDCCYSGAVNESIMKGGVDQELQRVSGGQGIYVVTASSAIQVAQEMASDKYSLLTKHLVDGLSEAEADVDGDGYVSMDELFKYAETNVRKEGRQQPIKFAVNVQGELMIARSGKIPREERRKEIQKRLYELRAQNIITDLLLEQAQKVNSLAAEALSGESKRQTDLLDQLLDKKIEIGEFIEKWYSVGSSPALPAPHVSSPRAAPAGHAGQTQKAVLRRTLPRQTGGVLAGALSPRGTMLVTASGDGTLWMWDTRTGELKAQAQGSPPSPAWALAISPDGSTIAAGDRYGRVRLLSWQGVLLRTLEGGWHREVLALAYSDDGARLCVGGVSATDNLVVHNLSGGGDPLVFPSGHGAVNRVRFSGNQLVSAGADRALRLWHGETGQLEKTLEAHNDSVYALALNESGRLAATGASDGSVRLWESSAWVRQAVLRGHKDTVLTVDLHPNGRTIASGSADGAIKLWDAASQEMTLHIESGHISVNFVAFAPGGEWLVSGGADQTVRFWDLGGSSRSSRIGS